MEKESRFIIIDHGANFIRVGFGNEDKPSLVIHSIVGSKRSTIGRTIMPMPGMMKPNNSNTEGVYSYAKEAIAQANILRIDNTIEDRKELKQSAKSLYIKIFKDLNLYDEKLQKMNDDFNYNVVYLASSFVDLIFLEQVSRIFLDFFKVNLCILPQALAVVNSHQSGFVIDIGETFTDFISVMDHKILKFSSEQIQLGGKDLTNFLKEFYEDYEFFKFGSTLKVVELKQSHSIVSLDFDKDLNSSAFNKVDYEIEDEIYSFTNEFIKTGEILFDPTICKKDVAGIHKTTQNLQQKLIVHEFNSDDNINKDNVFSKIFLVGATSRIKNLSTRLKLELEKFNNNFELIFDQENPDLTQWIGAKKLLENNFEFKWIKPKGEDRFDFQSFLDYIIN